jgi:serine/threonine protein kinase/class 3 adenylate cyclase
MTDPTHPAEDVSSEPAVEASRSPESLRTCAEPSTQLTGGAPSLAPPLPAGPRLLPSQLGRYRILKRLGSGGMASVFLAHDTELDRQVALKVPHFDPKQEQELLERFSREARAAANLHHPNICPLYDVGRIDDIPYLTMAFIEGQTLAQSMEPGKPWPQRDAAALVQTIALTLEDAHSHGIVHRDLKPSNIMLNSRGEPIIMDFGLARRTDRPEQPLTVVGHVVGTPAYMPPEQVRGDAAVMGPASDIYSLGVILYELLTGRLPFQGSLTALLAQILHEQPPPAGQHRADLDPTLEAICTRALAKQAADRFPSMAHLADALRVWLAGAPTLVETGSRRETTLDAEMATTVLDLLRTWGWGMGVRKLKGKVQNARDPRKRASLQVLLTLVSGESPVGAASRATPNPALRSLPTWRALVGWALSGQSSAALRDRDYRRAHRLLDQAYEQGDESDTILQATLAHLRGSILSHEGKTEQALHHLHEALALFGKDHFAAGRVLDTLGMVYCGRGNFRMAREFYEQAIHFKDRCQDQPGLALSHGQLGRLYLDWGHLDQAEEHFQIDLRLAEKLLDKRGEAQMYNHLGQVALARAEMELAAGRKSLVRRHAGEATGWLDSSVRLAEASKHGVAEGFARKDLALVDLLDGDVPAAEQQAEKADTLFRAAGFGEGLALVNRVWGIIRRLQGRTDEATRKLRSALSYFESIDEHAEATRTLWELARTQRAARANAPLVARAYVEALTRAEQSRRDHLVRAIEEELREVDHETYYRHLYRRVRGQADWEEASSLSSGASEVATVLFFDLQGFSESSRGLDPEMALQTFNQMLADLEAVLLRYKAKPLAYFGDGFLALLREARHAERAVQAALDLMAELREFNRPRQILDLPLFQGRIGIHTGNVFLGNVGTYRKMDYTVVGPTVSLASRLLNWAQPDWPCISRATRELLPDRFQFQEGNPRTVTPPGLEACEVWDVVGVRKVG